MKRGFPATPRGWAARARELSNAILGAALTARAPLVIDPGLHNDKELAAAQSVARRQLAFLQKVWSVVQLPGRSLTRANIDSIATALRAAVDCPERAAVLLPLLEDFRTAAYSLWREKHAEAMRLGFLINSNKKVNT